jgi:hypothetical protein
MLTEGHWWSDRVDQPNEILQRERLGGIALRRNQTVPGNVVSWRFDDPEGAAQVAILFSGGTPGHFKIVAYNMSDRPQQAAMTGWNVPAGTWRVTTGVDANADDKADGPTATGLVPLERSASTILVFAPHQTSIVEFALQTPAVPVEQRPDLGIGEEDVVVKGRQAIVTVHSLGAAATPAANVRIEDGQGRLLGTAAVPSLPAPLDLYPKTVRVTVTLSRPAPRAGLRVGVSAASGTAEVTQLNNKVVLR